MQLEFSRMGMPVDMEASAPPPCSQSPPGTDIPGVSGTCARPASDEYEKKAPPSVGLASCRCAA